MCAVPPLEGNCEARREERAHSRGKGDERSATSSCSQASSSAKAHRGDRLCVVLDLDECLVHSILTPGGREETLRGESPRTVEAFPDSFRVTFDDGELATVNKRPYVDEFLQALAQEFDVVVFTAAAEDYATAVLDRLDPDGTLIRRRLFRDSCRRVGLALVKDLRAVVPANQLHRVVLVDNSLNNFLYQPSNGIPVPAFYDQRGDDALLGVLQLLRRLQEEADVRPVLKETFGVEQLMLLSNPGAELIRQADSVAVCGPASAPQRMTASDIVLVVLLTLFYAALIVAVVAFVLVPLASYATRAVGLPLLGLLHGVASDGGPQCGGVGGDGAAAVAAQALLTCASA